MAGLWPIPACTSVDFISDLHLQASRPRTTAALLHYLKVRPPGALVVLGDLFEVWVGDDCLSDSSAKFEYQVLQAFAATSALGPVAWVCGNRDFLLGTAAHALARWHVLPDPCVVDTALGQCLITHGDAWCLQDQDYLQFRQKVRSTAWQNEFLALPLTQRQQQALSMREHSQSKHMTRPQGVDVDLNLAIRQLQQHHCNHLVHGHTHQPQDQALTADLVRHVLSDWEMDAPIQATRAQILRWTAQGFARLNVLKDGVQNARPARSSPKTG